MNPALRRLALAFLGASALHGAARLPAGPGVNSDAPPAANRPENFSEVVGSYGVADTAAPTELHVEDALLLTVRITGSGPAAYQPQRRHLHLFPAGIDKDFYVKPLPEKDRHLPREQTWEFAYELRPKHPGVAKVPALALAYYDPAYRRYQTSYARSIPLKVTPRAQALPPAEEAPGLPAPESLYELVTGPGVLRREAPDGPGLLALVALLLAPPLLCGFWYLGWRRRHPDEARLARQRRSRAAEQALRALRGGGPEAVAGAVAAYLRQRLDLPAEEPTPREAARHLRRLGLAPALAWRTAALFRACDAARFGPARPTGGNGLTGDAARLILDLEAEPWSSTPA